jgi:hypothetical protein
MMKKLQCFLLAAAVMVSLPCGYGTCTGATRFRRAGSRCGIRRIGNFMRPIWSPTGDRIAMAGHSFTGLYVADVATGDVNRISSEAGAGFGAEWSHDGVSPF